MEFLLFIAIVYILYKLLKPKDTKQESAVSNVSMSDPAVKTLIDEAVAVVNDMLEVGHAAQIYSGSDYEGVIYAHAYTRPPYSGRAAYGIQIIMADVKNLEDCVDRYPKMWSNPDNLEMNANLAYFMNKYSRYHDPNENRYVYRTTHTAPLKYTDKTSEVLKSLLFDQVEKRCPLANIRNGVVYTKNVAR